MWDAIGREGRSVDARIGVTERGGGQDKSIVAISKIIAVYNTHVEGGVVDAVKTVHKVES